LVEHQAIAFNLNAYLLDPANLKEEFKLISSMEHSFRQVQPITCASGLTFSAQASVTHYCTPRDSVGPWEEVEVGFPSERVEEFMEYADDPDEPTGTVYGYVPVEVVEAVVDSHGGIVQRCLSDSQ
jgi:hypothetical protein